MLSTYPTSPTDDFDALVGTRDAEVTDATDVTRAFSDAMAEVYDEVYPSTPDLDDVGTMIQRLTGHTDVTVLEVGVGTGRIALRLAAQGMRVQGVDTSPLMLARLTEKDPQGTVTPVLGSITDGVVSGTFDVVLAPFNVLCCAVRPEEQIAMMCALAERTAPGGYVVVETFDPSDFHVLKGPQTNTYPLSDGAVVETVNILASSQNMMLQTTLFVGTAAPTSSSTVMRYLWPSEIDLLAGVAGLELCARHSGWNDQPFVGGDSRSMCVSVFRKREQ